jgi:hypothetical protein
LRRQPKTIRHVLGVTRSAAEEMRTKEDESRKCEADLSVLLVFALSLVIPPFGSKDFLNTLTKVPAQESHKSKDMVHGSVLLLERILNRSS